MKLFAKDWREHSLAAPRPRLSLRANFSWTLVGQIVYNTCQWALIVVLAKLGSPELVGQYTIALAITAPVFMLTNLGLRTVQTTDVQDRNAFADYFGLRILCSLLGLVFVAGVLWIGSYEGVLGVVALVSLSKLTESLSEVGYGQMQKHERLDLVSRSLMIRGLVSLAAMAVTLYFFRSLVAALGTQLVVWGIVLALHDLPGVRRWQTVRPRFDSRTLRSLFWLALPLGIVAGLNSLGTQVPRYAIEHFGGQRELGFFAAIASLGLVVNLITVALSQSAMPRLSLLYARGAYGRFARLLFRLMALGAGMGLLGVIGAAVLGKPFLQIVYTSEYTPYANVLVVTMASTGVLAAFTFVGTAVAAARQFAVQSVIHVAKVATIGAACLLLIPRLGILGAAWSVLIGAVFSATAYSFVLWRTVRRARKQSAVAP